MNVTTLKAADRDLLREGLCHFAGVIESAHRAAELGEPLDDASRTRLEGVLHLLDALGWEMEGESDIYRLPDTAEARAILIEMRDSVREGIEDEEVVDPDHAAEVLAACEMVVGPAEVVAEAA